MRTLRAVISITMLAGLILLGVQQTPTAAGATPAYTDIALYRQVVTDMRGGAGYYEAAVSEARKHHYPLRPFVTVRLPTLAWLLSTIGERAGHFCLMALALGTLCAWAAKLRLTNGTKAQRATALVCLTTGMFTALVPDFTLFHETWAGVLIALSLAIRRKDAWVISVLIGITAALTRELAGAYLLAMAAMALKDRNTREAATWFIAIAILALALAVHAMSVSSLVMTSDLVSPGWLSFGGWRFVTDIMQCNVFLALVPPWLAAIIVPLALFGLSQIDQRLLLVVSGYVFTFLMVGRTENMYWGLLIAPIWALGLVGAWPAIASCLSDIRPVSLVQWRKRQGGLG
jgi:hypothetical protein